MSWLFARTGEECAVDWRRLALVVATSLAAVCLFTPLLGMAVGASPRKSSHLVLVITFLLAQAATARGGVAREAGFTGTPRPARRWWTGFVVGVTSLLTFGLVLLALGERETQDFGGWEQLAWAALRYLPLAFVIGCLEDVSFFGFLHLVLGRRLWPPALVFGVTHFLHIDKQAAFGEEPWLHGFQALGYMVDGLERIGDAGVEFAGLILLGLVLCGLRRVTGSVWVAMGLHGGWYWQRTIGRKWSEDSSGDLEWLFGTDRFIDGLLGWALVLATGLVLSNRFRGSSEPSQDQPEH
ncbi:MAG: CPBP family intramembrane metalloprotease [Planctomycetes bacterium]|nr:CPBP family intramembrane metalloprotease [Planctomycetota bacterium]